MEAREKAKGIKLSVITLVRDVKPTSTLEYLSTISSPFVGPGRPLEYVKVFGDQEKSMYKWRYRGQCTGHTRESSSK
jgi:hypothetical protein